ncbi:transglutaminaseTgpA domain-containing protein [Herbiconiux sp. 11R-BC]|uniref:transglutaminase family protein n=1 Tax=Herbiconiux sp. 11R-BC TaxID=3111637 RepID=UPI003BFA7C55
MSEPAGAGRTGRARSADGGAAARGAGTAERAAGADRDRARARRERMRGAGRAADRGPAPARPVWAVALDSAAVALLLVVAALGFGPAFGGSGYLVAAGGAIVLALAITLLAVRFAWNILIVTAATMLAYLLFGGALAAPSTTLFGVLPTLETVRTLVLGIVFSWKDVLTLETPLGGFPSTLVVPFLSTLVAGVLAFGFALRLRRAAAWALLPASALLVTGIVFGTREAAAPVLQGLLFSAVALGWWAWRRQENRAEATRATAVGASGPDPASARRLRTTRLATGAGLVVVAMAVGLGAAAAAPAASREVLRDQIEPPLDLHDYASPLVGFRSFVRDEKDQTLFTVHGLPTGARIRLATLDSYDGLVYNVAGDGSSGSGTFTRVSADIPSDTAGDKATLDVTIDQLTGVWIPDAGYLDTVRFTGDRASELAGSLHYNSVTGVALTTDGLTAGDSYTMDVTIPPSYNDEQLSTRGIENLSMPRSTGVPDALTSLATTYAGDTSVPLDQVRNIASSLSQGGFFSHGLEGEATSRAGHGAERIASLVSADQMVGDDEQYSVAMALMVRSLGIPARVVMGFYPAESAGPDATQQITGDDVHAWVEVPFEGVGWMPFDPTPPKDQVPEEQAPKPKADPKAQVLQPPPPPQEPAELPPDIRTDDTDQEAVVDDNSMLGLILLVGGGVLALLVVLLVPVLVISLAKARRRRRRRSAPVPADRLSGGWDEIVDRARDLGTPTTPGVTRRETAVVLATAFPQTPVIAAASAADTGVFGPGEPSPAEVEAFWTEVDGIVAGMGEARTPWQRLRARLSLRSLLRRGRGPVRSQNHGTARPDAARGPGSDAPTPSGSTPPAADPRPTGSEPSHAVEPPRSESAGSASDD